MKGVLLLAMALFIAAPSAAAEGFRGGRRARMFRYLPCGTISSLIASPGSISFIASNPGSGSVSGSSPASVNWTVQSGNRLQTWSLSVQADAGYFSGCPTVPVSAVGVECSGASVSGPEVILGTLTVGGGGTGVCGGGFSLSTVAHQVAGGAEGDGTQVYSVQINYSLAESWRYVANSSCSLSLTYTVNAP